MQILPNLKTVIVKTKSPEKRETVEVCNVHFIQGRCDNRSEIELHTAPNGRQFFQNVESIQIVNQ